MASDGYGAGTGRVLAVDTVPPLLTAVAAGRPDRVVATFSKPVEGQPRWTFPTMRSVRKGERERSSRPRLGRTW